MTRGLAWSVGAYSKHNGDENHSSSKRAICHHRRGASEGVLDWLGFGRGIALVFLCSIERRRLGPKARSRREWPEFEGTFDLRVGTIVLSHIGRGICAMAAKVIEREA